MKKVCPNCKESKVRKDFYSRRGVEGNSTYCKACANVQTSTRQKNLKIKSVEYLGGKCIKCGYNSYVEALEFHHIDPKGKDFSISRAKSHSFENVKTELDKCVLLCANCHREHHADERKANRPIWLDRNEKHLNNKVELDSYQRPKRHTKIDWLSDEDLAKIVWEYPRSHLAKVWGISDVAIAKRLKLRGIEQPPRGYWAKARAKKIITLF